jgi:hypothetical protein
VTVCWELVIPIKTSSRSSHYKQGSQRILFFRYIQEADNHDRSGISVTDVVSRIRVGQPRNCGSILGRSKYSSSSITCPDLISDSPSFLHNVYLQLLPWGQSGRDVSPTTYLELMTKLRMSGAIPPFAQMSSWSKKFIFKRRNFTFKHQRFL